MNSFFIIKEGILGFKRARLAVTISVISISLSLLLVGIFGVTLQNIADIFEQSFKRVQLEVFIDPSLAISQVKRLEQRIQQNSAVDSVSFISPEQALKKFEQDFGEELVTVLDENPLPPSIRVVLNPRQSDLSSVETIVQEIESINGVDDVVYQTDIIRLVNEYFLIGVIISIAFGFVIFIISTLLIFNTIRLTIYSRKTIIEIMRLVGATHFFIKGPFIMEGIFQGIIGALIACGLLWLSNYSIKGIFENILSVPLPYYIGLISLGAFLGLLGSWFSVNKYLRY